MYIQTWHLVNEAFASARSCSGELSTFEIVTNNYIRYTLRTNGSAIDEVYATGI